MEFNFWGSEMKCLSVLVAAGLLSTPAMADAELRKCASIESRDKRLDCFDRLSAARLAPANAAPALPADVKSVAVPTPEMTRKAVEPGPSAAGGVDRFGRTELGHELNEISSHVVGLLEGWDAQTEIELANGQRWRIADGSSAYLNLHQPQVKVVRGFMGGYILRIEGSNKQARVRRVK